MNQSKTLLMCKKYLALMFMKNITTKTKQMTELLQAEDLNIIDAIVIIKSTIEGLCRINKDEDGMNAEIQAGIQFTSRVGGNANEEFKRKHRLRRKPRWLDESHESEHSFDICTFYRKEFKAVLDLQIVEFGENLSLCLQVVKPLAAVLQPPLKSPSLEDVHQLVKLFADKMSMDSFAFISEMENFLRYSEMTRKNFKSLAEAAIFSEEMKGTFPLTNRAYRLLLTAPVTVAKDERVFSRLKLIKTHLRTTMTEKRLEALMMLSCEKDLTDNANLDKIAESWAVLKSLKVKL